MDETPQMLKTLHRFSICAWRRDHLAALVSGVVIVWHPKLMTSRKPKRGHKPRRLNPEFSGNPDNRAQGKLLARSNDEPTTPPSNWESAVAQSYREAEVPDSSEEPESGSDMARLDRGARTGRQG
jgi:hypothetical protein